MLGALLSAGTSIASGLFGASSAKKAAKANADLQREFAQNSVQWRVADAKKAGVHPLYALGAPSVSATPSYVGDTTMASALASAGQDISRAVDASSSQSVRKQNFDARVRDLTLTKMGLENELLASQISKLRAGTGPGIPGADADESSQSQLRPTLNLIEGITATPRRGEAKSQVVEDEYGGASDVVGALRMMRDAGKGGHSLPERLGDMSRRQLMQWIRGLIR